MQDEGCLYISLKPSLPPISDIYLQFLPTHSFHTLRQTLLFKYCDFWWFFMGNWNFGQLKLWYNVYLPCSSVTHKVYITPLHACMLRAENNNSKKDDNIIFVQLFFCKMFMFSLYHMIGALAEMGTMYFLCGGG